jgi:hypothetical protein
MIDVSLTVTKISTVPHLIRLPSTLSVVRELAISD